MPNDRSDATLRERLELAEKATKGPWIKRSRDFQGEDGFGWESKPTVEAEDKMICLFYDRDVDADDVDNDEDDAAHIAASSPDVVREDIEEILQLRKERDWLLREIVNTSDRQFCPMPDRYECLYHVGHECKSREVEMRVGCWRTAVECAVKYEEGKNNVE